MGDEDQSLVLYSLRSRDNYYIYGTLEDDSYSTFTTYMSVSQTKANSFYNPQTYLSAPVAARSGIRLALGELVFVVALCLEVVHEGTKLLNKRFEGPASSVSDAAGFCSSV